jgi:hypothetical protein
MLAFSCFAQYCSKSSFTKNWCLYVDYHSLELDTIMLVFDTNGVETSLIISMQNSGVVSVIAIQAVSMKIYD